MATDERRLLSVLDRLSDPAKVRHAVLIDLSGIENADEPVLHRTLWDWLRGPGAAGGADPDGAATGVEAWDLAHNRLVLAIDAERLEDRRQALVAAAERLARHKLGVIRTEWFELPKSAAAFARRIRSLAAAAEGDAPPRPDPQDELGAEAVDLDRFLVLERSLHAADLSALMRQQPVYSFAADGDPKPVQLEVTVSLAELERRLNVPFRRNPWLYARATELLDRRMLYALLRDPVRSPLPVAVKLHVESVLNPTLVRVVQDFPTGRQGQLTVELPYVEWQTRPDAFLDAMEQLQRLDVSVAMDHLPANRLVGSSLPEIAFYRVMWQDDEGHVADLAACRERVAALGADRCILVRCHTAAAVEAGLAAGFTLLQGRAVDQFVAERHQISWQAQRNAIAVPVEAAADAEAGAADPAPKPKGPFGWVTRLFRPQRPPTGGD